MTHREPTRTEGTLVAIDGDLPGAGLVRDLLSTHTALVAADGAASRLLDDGIVPDVVIGDLDAIGDRRSELAARGALIVEIADQERNDFEKALGWCIDRGETRVTIVGIAGGMVDHTLNNFSILSRFARLLRLRLRDADSTAHVATGDLLLRTTPGDRVSLIPLPSARLTTTGLAWELRDEVLAMGVREGASNRAVAEEISLSVHEGTVLAFHFDGGTYATAS